MQNTKTEKVMEAKKKIESDLLESLKNLYDIDEINEILFILKRL